MHMIQDKEFYDDLALGQDTAFSEALVNESCPTSMLISIMIRLCLLRR